MRALLVVVAVLGLPAVAAHASPPVQLEREDLEPVHDALDVQQDAGPADTARQMGKGLLRMLLTGMTTCGGLSACTGSMLGCGFSVLLLLYGFSAPNGVYLMTAGAVGLGFAVLLGASALLVFLPISFVLRYFGLWDTWTEQFVWSIFQVLLVAF